MQNNKRAAAQQGNQNAKKDPADRRAPLTIRLPADLIEQLRARGNVTAQIEQAVKRFLED